MNKEFDITKKDSAIIKGIAILMMMIHHAFTFPDWILSGGGYEPNLIFARYFNSPTKLCVCVFAFVTGWAYALHEHHTFKETINRVAKFLVTYWVVCVPVLLLSSLLWNYPLAENILLEIFGLKNQVMMFCWYVFFYIVSMALMLLIYRLLDKGVLIGVIFGIVIPIVVFSFACDLCQGTAVKTAVNNLKHWFPCIAVGYLCNRYRAFAYFRQYTYKIPWVLELLFGFIFCGVGRYFLSGLDFLYCAILVYVIMEFINKTSETNIIKNCLYSVGLVSTNMWFLHCLFFSPVTREFFQPLAYWTNCPLLILVVLTMEVYFVSWLITKLDNHVLKWIWFEKK